MMILRSLLHVTALSALIAGIASAVPMAGSKPNIILVMTDDQGYPAVGAHGHPWLETPHLDAMHASSVRFDRFMMGSTCAPSRAGLMSGSHSIRNGVTHTIFERERLNLQATTIAEVLQPAGYTSGYFGKWHLGDEPDYQPEKRGFEEVFIHGAGGIGQRCPGSGSDVPDNSYFDPVFKQNGTFVKTQGYCTDVLFQATLGWVKEVKDQDEPFFALLSPNAPHSPFIAPPAYQQKFQDLGFSKNAAGFYGMIEHLDLNMGLLFAKLEEWGIADNTIVIFTSDNGMTRGGSGLNTLEGRPQKKLGTSKSGEDMMTYNANMKGMKGCVDEGGVRAPLFVKWPARYLDILPTFAELAGAQLPQDHFFEGRSLVPLLAQENPEWEDRYLFQHVTRWGNQADPDDHKWYSFSVRNQRFRLVENTTYEMIATAPERPADAPYPSGPALLSLYDMENDPSQTKDVSSEHPELVADMLKQYEAFWLSVRPEMINDNIPIPSERIYHVEYNHQKDTIGIPAWKAPTL